MDLCGVACHNNAQRMYGSDTVTASRAGTLVIAGGNCGTIATVQRLHGLCPATCNCRASCTSLAGCMRGPCIQCRALSNYLYPIASTAGRRPQLSCKPHSSCRTQTCGARAQHLTPPQLIPQQPTPVGCQQPHTLYGPLNHQNITLLAPVSVSHFQDALDPHHALLHEVQLLGKGHTQRQGRPQCWMRHSWVGVAALRGSSTAVGLSLSPWNVLNCPPNSKLCTCHTRLNLICRCTATHVEGPVDFDGPAHL